MWTTRLDSTIVKFFHVYFYVAGLGVEHKLICNDITHLKLYTTYVIDLSKEFIIVSWFVLLSFFFSPKLTQCPTWEQGQFYCGTLNY